MREESVIEPALAATMVEMVGFRNALGYEYDSIQHDRVFDHLYDLDHFDEYATGVLEYLQSKASDSVG